MSRAGLFWCWPYIVSMIVDFGCLGQARRHHGLLDPRDANIVVPTLCSRTPGLLKYCIVKISSVNSDRFYYLAIWTVLQWIK